MCLSASAYVRMLQARTHHLFTACLHVLQAALASWDALPEEQKAARIMQLQLAATLKKKRVVAE